MHYWVGLGICESDISHKLIYFADEFRVSLQWIFGRKNLQNDLPKTIEQLQIPMFWGDRIWKLQVIEWKKTNDFVLMFERKTFNQCFGSRD